MGIANPHDILLCTFEEKRQSRMEIDTSLVFDPRSKVFQIRVSQDYETQAKISVYYSDADEYFAKHPEHREKARQTINGCMAENPEHATAMKAALARLKNL